MKSSKIKQIKALLSKSEAKGVDTIYIQPKQSDEPLLFKEIANGRNESVNIYVTSQECAENLVKLFEP